MSSSDLSRPSSDGDGRRHCQSCRAVLAVDNTARLCGRCHRDQRDQLGSAPTQYPPDFFDSDEFRAAFASQHIGKVFRAYRNHQRHFRLLGKALNQEILGRWLGLTQAQVSKLENGKPEQNLEPLRHYAMVLHLPQQKLWFDLPGQSRLDHTRSGRGRRAVAADPEHEDRCAPENAAAAASTIVDFNSLGCGGDRIEVDDLPQLRRQMTRLVEIDNQFGGGDIAKTGVRLFKYLHHRLGTGSHDPAIRKDLVAITGEVAEITGWLAYDADDQQLVRRMNNEALHFSRLAGDSSIELLTLQNASMHADFLGRWTEALDIADSVLDGRYELTSRLKALFLVRKARALALGGDQSALRLMHQARSLHADGVSDRDPAWAWWVDERELSWHEAMCRAALGDSTSARDSFEHSVEATPPHETRSQYVHRSYLLRSQVSGRSWAEAAATIDDLAPLAMQVASNRTVRLLRAALDSEEPPGTPRAFHDASNRLQEILDDPTI
jgi:hypothetical protein